MRNTISVLISIGVILVSVPVQADTMESLSSLLHAAPFVKKSDAQKEPTRSRLSQDLDNSFGDDLDDSDAMHEGKDAYGEDEDSDSDGADSRALLEAEDERQRCIRAIAKYVAISAASVAAGYATKEFFLKDNGSIAIHRGVAKFPLEISSELLPLNDISSTFCAGTLLHEGEREKAARCLGQMVAHDVLVHYVKKGVKRLAGRERWIKCRCGKCDFMNKALNFGAKFGLSHVVNGYLVHPLFEQLFEGAQAERG